MSVADAESKLGLCPELTSDDLYLENDLYLLHTGHTEPLSVQASFLQVTVKNVSS